LENETGTSLVQYLAPEQILVGIEAHDRYDLMSQMLDALVKSPSFRAQANVSREQAWQALVEREKKQSTGIGDGVAFPHGRIPGYKGLSVCLAVLKHPVDYGSIDGKPVQIACMMLAPEEQPALALRLYSKVAELLADKAIRDYFLSVTDASAIYDYLREREFTVETTLTARDIMRSDFLKLSPEMPLQDVTHLMMRHRVEAAAVLEKDESIVGMITCDDLFRLGVPEFFSHLQSVAFIREFDPFEKYFLNEGKACAKDVMSRDFAALPLEATMLEIVFALTVQKYPKVYIVKDDKCIGVIDRTTVLDRIINF